MRYITYLAILVALCISIPSFAVLTIEAKDTNHTLRVSTDSLALVMPCNGVTVTAQNVEAPVEWKIDGVVQAGTGTTEAFTLTAPPGDSVQHTITATKGDVDTIVITIHKAATVTVLQQGDLADFAFFKKMMEDVNKSDRFKEKCTLTGTYSFTQKTGKEEVSNGNGVVDVDTITSSGTMTLSREVGTKIDWKWKKYLDLNIKLGAVNLSGALSMVFDSINNDIDSGDFTINGSAGISGEFTVRWWIFYAHTEAMVGPNVSNTKDTSHPGYIVVTMKIVACRVKGLFEFKIAGITFKHKAIDFPLWGDIEWDTRIDY